jgi:acyl-CoA thioesterase-1
MQFAAWAIKPLTIAALIAGLALPFAVHAEQPACDVPQDMLRFAKPLARVAKKVANHEPLVIVAIGSSSTAGAGASSPSMNYPNRLAAELKQLFPRNPITVVNRGVNGEEIADMLQRFDEVVVKAKPDLVLWQLGTNSIIRDHVLTTHDAQIHDGLTRIRSVGADVVLIDPQYTPKVIVKAQVNQMVQLISTAAKREDVDLFRRYDVMRRWKDVDHIPFEVSAAPDGLHLNDWSYGCMAKGLAQSIAEAAQRPIMSATAPAASLTP